MLAPAALAAPSFPGAVVQHINRTGRVGEKGFHAPILLARRTWPVVPTPRSAGMLPRPAAALLSGIARQRTGGSCAQLISWRIQVPSLG